MKIDITRFVKGTPSNGLDNLDKRTFNLYVEDSLIEEITKSKTNIETEYKRYKLKLNSGTVYYLSVKDAKENALVIKLLGLSDDESKTKEA